LTGNSIGAPSLTERQQAEEVAYLAKKDTKERPPAHIIDRERKAIDWKSLRHKGATAEVIEELMRMSTKNLKNPDDSPKRPMNGELFANAHDDRADMTLPILPSRSLFPLLTSYRYALINLY